jgi:ubiquinone/menaquinone biosynthesis C-methylase UbiE
MKWIYRHPAFYNFMDSVFSLSMADRVRRRVFETLKPRSLLEIGVGSGKNMRLLACPLRMGVDTSVSMLRHTQTKFHDVALVAADAISLPLRDASFDMSVFCYVLRGLRSPVQAVREALRVSSRVVIVDYDRPRFVPRMLWDAVINRFGRRVYGSKDLDFAAIEKLGDYKEVIRYYGGLYRVIILQGSEDGED